MVYVATELHSVCMHAHVHARNALGVGMYVLYVCVYPMQKHPQGHVRRLTT